MATKIQRIRRIVGIAIGAVKAIFRTGRAWGTAKTRVATTRRPTPAVSTGAAVAAGVAGGAAGAYFLDPKRGKRRRGAAVGRVKALVGSGNGESNAQAGATAAAANGASPETNGASAEKVPTKRAAAAVS